MSFIIILFFLTRIEVNFNLLKIVPKQSEKVYRDYLKKQTNKKNPHFQLTWSLKGRLEKTGRFLAHFTDMKRSLAEVSYTFSEPDGYKAMWYSEDACSGSLLVTSMFSSTETEKMSSESRVQRKQNQLVA